MSCYVGMAVPSFAMPVFDSASTFPLIAVTYYVEYIICNFINVYIFSH